ncbi:Protein ROLLING AND ERECT LEAF 2 [Cardamine amara subsp. amara]|uniref:Protein ROLLING AND ERECT LEAF 2 n=1 Tax=Cardamine amara subsp. amara TaxID=228776 RepID=A0ABD1B848_CARAN
MGCGGSKVDNQPLVILCRQRKELIKEASHHRSALAAAHLVYFQSLSDVGEAIRRYVDEEVLVASSSDSPVLTLPSDEGKPNKHKRFSPSSTASISHSVIEEEEEEGTEDSHLHLTSGSESESEDGSNDHIQINNSNPEKEEEERSTDTFHSAYDPITFAQPGYSYPVGGMHFMKKSAPRSRPFIFQPENHRVENAQWPSDSTNFGNSSYFPNTGVQRRSPATALPSPPRVSTWDFLNVFDAYDYSNGRYRASSYYPGMTSISSSPDSKEVREREGIPELEEESEQEVIKQVYRRPKRTGLEKVKEHRDEIRVKNINKRGYVAEETLRKVPMPERVTESSLDSETMSSFSGSDDESEFHHVDGGEGKSSNSSTTIMGTKSSGEVEEEYGNKKGVSFDLEETSTSSSDVESSKISSLSSLSIHATRDLREVVKEIKSEFEVASSCGKEVALLLEVSKLPYQHKNNGFKVILSRIMYLVAPSTRSSHSKPRLSIRLTSRTRKMAKAYNGQDVNRGLHGNLSSTLEKLYAWEKKLYKEVKDEEKLRSIYEEKCRRLKKMDSHGAESSKIEDTRASIMKLVTKIDVSIRSVDSISSRIHKLRDEELHPQLTQLIHGLIRMWRSMLKCHQKQFQAIMESKVRSLKAKTTLQKDSGSGAILDLEMELREWRSSFNDWVNIQKEYVQSLNGWLSKCLHYEPETTEDGIAPFSPSQIGAPPIFIICKDWQEAMGRISGENVSTAMQVFASSLHELWEKQEEERRVKAESEQRDAESERSVVSRGRSESGISALDDLKVDLDSMRKKLVDERGKRKENIKLVNNASSSSLKDGLVPIFGALRKFTAEVVKAHEIVRLQHSQASS